MQPGTIGILNVAAGDTKLSFDPSNPSEVIRSGRIVKDMLRRGYALLVEVERDGVKAYERALDFDHQTCEYIIADFDPIVAAEHDATESQENNDESKSSTEERTPEATPQVKLIGGGEKKRRGRPAGTKRIAADSTHAVGVSRSAGG